MERTLLLQPVAKNINEGNGGAMSVKQVAIFAAALGLSGFASATVIDQVRYGILTVTPLITLRAPR